MAIKIDIKSLIIGLLIGLIALSVFGATSGEKKGIYQLSMAAGSSNNSDSSSGYIIYGRIHTGTGKIETWKYLIGTNRAVPYLRDNTTILLGPDGKSLPD